MRCHRHRATPRAASAAVAACVTGLLVALLASCSTATESDSAPVTTQSAPTTTAPPTTSRSPSFEERMAEVARPSADAATLASRLLAAHERFETEVAAADPDERTLQIAAFDAQNAYRQLGRNPDWDDAVIAALPPERREAVRSHVAARREFRGMHRTLGDNIPAWRIVAPPPPDELRAHYLEGEAVHGVPWRVLAAVNLVETGMGRIQGFSVAGARGPMQFMPGTWDEFGEGDIDDPRDAILAAARYLAHNGGADGDLENALFRYNNSDRYVRGVLHYVEVLENDPVAHEMLHHWQVVYLSTIGDIWLAAGDSHSQPIPVADYLAANPLRHLGTDTR